MGNKTRDEGLILNQLPQTRSRQTRDNETIDFYPMKAYDPLEVPEYAKDDSLEFFWVNASIDNGMVDEKLDEGWILVELKNDKKKNINIARKNVFAKDFITYKDLVLMSRPKEIGEHQKRIDDQKYQLIINNIPTKQDLSNSLRFNDAGRR